MKNCHERKRYHEKRKSTDRPGAVVNCVIHFEVAGEQFARDSAIVLVEIRDRWYISYIDLFA
jgi:hypothetical protein